jgi:hypothetical protein
MWPGCVVRLGEVLVGRPEGKRPLGKRGHSCENNIEMDLTKIGFGGADFIHLAQDRGRWRAHVSTLMNHRVPYMGDISWLASQGHCSVELLSPDNGGSVHLWHFGLLQRDYTALYRRRLSSSHTRRRENLTCHMVTGLSVLEWINAFCGRWSRSASYQLRMNSPYFSHRERIQSSNFMGKH